MKMILDKVYLADESDKKERSLFMGFPENTVGLAVARKIIIQAQAEKLISFLIEMKSNRFLRVAQISATIALLAMLGGFGTVISDLFGGVGLLVNACVYGLFFAFTAWYLTTKRKKRTAGGIAALIAVFMVPFAACGIEQLFGVWPDNLEMFQGYNFWLYGSWLMIELSTVGVGFIVLAFVRFSFVIIPVLLALWHFTMDISAVITQQPHTNFESARIGSVVYGILLLCVSIYLDRRTKEDFSFWGYLFGLTALFVGLSSIEISSLSYIIIFISISLFSLIIAPFLERRIFLFFGAAALFASISYFLNGLFEDTVVLFFCIVALASVFISIIMLYVRNEYLMYKGYEKKLPAFIRKLKPHQRRYGYLARK
jgi:hypothetical protein